MRGPCATGMQQTRCCFFDYKKVGYINIFPDFFINCCFLRRLHAFFTGQGLFTKEK